MALGFLYGSGGGGSQPEPESKALIPKMTSNTTPSGVCSASSVYSSGYPAWKAFDGVESGDDRWATASLSAWLQYEFITPTVVKGLRISNSSDGAINVQLKGSNDGTSWTNIGNSFSVAGKGIEIISVPNNKNSYVQYRCDMTTSASSGIWIWSLQLYGYDPNYRPAVIYDHGSWGVGYDNPGGYTWSGSTPASFTLNSDKLSKAASTGNAMIGTTNKIDVSKFTTLHVLAKAITFASGLDFAGALAYDADKELSGRTYVGFTTPDEVVEYTLDVTSATSIYIFIWCNAARACEVYKIWLT